MGRTKVVHLDTHVLIWLYEGNVERFEPAGRHAIDSGDLVVSPAVVLELEFLHEIERLKPSASKLMQTLELEIEVGVCDLPFRKVVDYALREGWTRDPFDRMIVASARAASATLVSKDAKILANYQRSVW